ncbi:MAG: TraB/GumN family protein [Deltaproteobacteria bacterium]|nr:TraB/GumN family protein [Deltaproteobacteria bacterium]MDQ3297720.1 TraB/GumN family protein [Myxococcota bacterium]
MRRLLLVALVGVIAACGSHKPRCTIDVPVPANAPFLWRVQRGEGPVLWLFGTIHNGSAADVPAAAWRALASSPRFASELGNVDPDPEKLRDLARLPPGKGLDQQLATDDWWDLRDALRGVIREDDLKRTRPWYAMTRLTATVSPPPKRTMDFALSDAAAARKLPVDALESWDDQLSALAAAVVISDLAAAIHARHTMACELAGLRAFYRTGDLAAMQKLLANPRSAQLLVARNRRWLPQLEAYLAGQGAFVAVGLAHLIGESNLPALLHAAGYTVERSP